MAPSHALLRRADGGVIRYLPSHPHEGAVSAPRPGERGAGSGSRDEPHDGKTVQPDSCDRSLSARRSRTRARGCGSHFPPLRDYNWNTERGAPSFVDEPPSDGLQRTPQALSDTHTYARNIAKWLDGPANG